MTHTRERITPGPRRLHRGFLADAIAGLSGQPKSLPCKYLYDQRGSQLFEQICRLPQYYPTRTELAIMEQHAPEMAQQIGPSVMLVEFGSGSSRKSRILLDHLIDPAAYVPLDISRNHLLQTAKNLQEAYPHIEILPTVADFTQPFQLPASRMQPTHSAVYFPGSTIGNFTPADARRLLNRIARMLGEDSGLLIGIDLDKSPPMIEAAYNDSQRITEQFNKNILRRANRELDADFDLNRFQHSAVYNQQRQRVEISLVSTIDQEVIIGDQSFPFAAGEHLLTEYSHKYTIDGFSRLAATSGFKLHQFWTDPDNLFAVLHLVVDNH